MPSHRRAHRRYPSLWSVCLAAALSLACATAADPPRARNVIVLIGDGWGFNHVAAAGLYESGATGSQIVDQFPTQYGMSTHAANTPVYDPAQYWSWFNYATQHYTDSAAAATAMATGVKTDRGMIGVDSGGSSVQNVAERAEELGKRSGIVTSVQLSHATPAGFGAHNVSRFNYEEIAREMLLTSSLDVLMGCGHPWYDDDGDSLGTPNDHQYVGGTEVWDGLTKGGDDFDLDGNGSYETPVGDADGDGAPDAWMLVETRADVQALAAGAAPARVLVVPRVADTLQYQRSGDASAAPYIVPLTTTVPTLAEMTAAALNVLDDDPDGFFLVVEGGAIDWAAHNTRSGRMIEEALAFNAAVQTAVDWVTANSSWAETLIIVCADHETGYLTGPGSGPDPDDPGDGTPPVWNPLVSNGAGNVPGMEWHYNSHTNSLVPFYAAGQARAWFDAYADQSDPVRGLYLDNAELGLGLFEALGDGLDVYHTGDYWPSTGTPGPGNREHDFVMNVHELLRIIQFYNAGAIHTDDTTEDGCAPGAGEHGTPHNSDYWPATGSPGPGNREADWTIDIHELLRFSQLYNNSGYRADGTTEDGFAPLGTPGTPAATVTGGRQVTGNRYVVGQNLTVSVHVEHSGGLSALGVTEETPAGWSFVSSGGDDAPVIVPAAGATGTLAFAWLTPPASPVDFTYTVSVPGDESGVQTVDGTVLYRTTGAEQQAAMGETALTPALPIAHGVATVSGAWSWVNLPTGFTNPVVVAGPATLNDAEPGVVRLRFVQAHGFAIRFQEWDYLDGSHAPEQVHWVAIDSGVYDLGGGDRLVASKLWTNRTNPNAPRRVVFPQSFGAWPVVLAQVQTNQGSAVTDRICKVFAGMFAFVLQEEEAGGAHGGEQVGYIAVSQGVTQIGSVTCEAKRSWVKLKHTPAWVGTAQGGTQVFVEEEASSDAETDHWIAEYGGFLGLGGMPPYVADLQTCWATAASQDTSVLRCAVDP